MLLEIGLKIEFNFAKFWPQKMKKKKKQSACSSILYIVS